QIHVDQRRIRQLHDEDAVTGNGADGLHVDVSGQGVKAVEDQADARVVGPPHHFPGVPMVVDVPPPGERLVAHAQAAGAGTGAEFAEIGGGSIDATERLRRYRGADQHQVAADLLHQVEL